MLAVYIPNLLRMKRFHEALAGTVQACSLTSHIGRVRTVIGNRAWGWPSINCEVIQIVLKRPLGLPCLRIGLTFPTYTVTHATQCANVVWLDLVQQFNCVALAQHALHQDRTIDTDHTIVGFRDLP